MAAEPAIDRELLLALPKADLHVHLDGSLRASTLLELARERGIALPSDNVQGLEDLVFRDCRHSWSNIVSGIYLSYLCGFAPEPRSWTRAGLRRANSRKLLLSRVGPVD